MERISRASPKSAILTSSGPMHSRFSGFMSRWKKPGKVLTKASFVLKEIHNIYITCYLCRILTILSKGQAVIQDSLTQELQGEATFYQRMSGRVKLLTVLMYKSQARNHLKQDVSNFVL